MRVFQKWCGVKIVYILPLKSIRNDPTNNKDHEPKMDQEKFNLSMRKFLKQVGVTSQQQIEDTVRSNADLAGKGPLKVKVVLTAEGTDLNHIVEGTIDLS